MKINHLCAIVTSAVIFLGLSNAANAEIYRVYFDAFTTNYSNPADQQMNFWVEVYDTEKKNPPEFVESITITAPDGTVFTMDPVHTWLPFDEGYWDRMYEGDFVGGTPFIKGNYKCEVVGMQGRKITKIDNVPGKFLPIPVITKPAADATNVGLTSTIRWDRVLGAKFYRILLWDNSWNEPRYWFWKKRVVTDKTSWTFPPGVLQLGHHYSLRIEARTNDQDIDSRSRSDWLDFTATSTP